MQSLSRLEQGDFDIIVLDIKGVAGKITELDGFGILQQIKQVNSSQIIIAFSGETFDIGKTQFFKLADDVLAKPVDTLKCKQVLDQLIQEKFTVEQLWGAVASLLRREHVSDKEIGSLEAQLYKLIQSGGAPDYAQIVKTVVDKADVALRIGAVLDSVPN